jgi:hypothetical protein
MEFPRDLYVSAAVSEISLVKRMQREQWIHRFWF